MAFDRGPVACAVQKWATNSGAIMSGARVSCSVLWSMQVLSDKTCGGRRGFAAVLPFNRLTRAYTIESWHGLSTEQESVGFGRAVASWGPVAVVIRCGSRRVARATAAVRRHGMMSRCAASSAGNYASSRPPAFRSGALRRRLRPVIWIAFQAIDAASASV